MSKGVIELFLAAGTSPLKDDNRRLCLAMWCKRFAFTWPYQNNAQASSNFDGGCSAFTPKPTTYNEFENKSSLFYAVLVEPGLNRSLVGRRSMSSSSKREDPKTHACSGKMSTAENQTL